MDDPEAREIASSLLEFVKTNNLDDSRGYLEKHPGLLTARAEAVLEAWADAQENSEERTALAELRFLLRRCREIGLDAAFREMAPSAPEAGGTDGNDVVPVEFEGDHLEAQKAGASFRRRRDVDALREALAAWERIVKNPLFGSAEPEFRLAALIDAGGAFRDAYEALGDVAALNKAIEFWRAALAEMPSGSSREPALLHSLALALTERSGRIDGQADLDEGINAFERAIERTPAGSPDLSSLVNNLGTALSRRYNLNGNLDDLNAAIDAGKQAVQAPPGTSGLPMFLNNLSLSLSDRYARNGDLADLNAAILFCEQAVQLASAAGDSNLPRLHTDLGHLLDDRYSRNGDVTDLNAAILAYERAVEQTPADAVELAGHLNNLGSALRDRHTRTGDLTDLEEAIQMCTRAVELTAVGSPELSRRLANLGAGLGARYGRSGKLDDLEAAIDAIERAVRQTTADSPDYPGFLNNLGIELRRRYEAGELLADLESAIQAFRQSVEHTPVDSQALPMRLNSLACGLKDRSDATGETNDLEEAIQLFGRAAKLAPAESPALAWIMNNLGNGLSSRFKQTGEIADLGGAITAYRQAVERSPGGAFDLPKLLTNLGEQLMKRFARSLESADIEEATEVLERARSLLQASFVAAPVSYKLGQEEHLALLNNRLAWAHLSRGESNPHLASSYCRAFEVTESSKSELLSGLQGRSDPTLSAGIPPEHAARERELLDALLLLDTRELADWDRQIAGHKSDSGLENLQKRERYVQDLERIWDEISRTGPEAAAYVAMRRADPSNWKEFTRLAADAGRQTAFLSFLAGLNETVLFILRAGWKTPAVVKVELGEEEWIDLARRFDREIRGQDGTGRRGETWDRYLRPLMDDASQHLAGVERLILSPSLVGHLIPWSVVVSRSGYRAPDGHPLPLVTMPGLSMLPRLRRRPRSRNKGTLVIGNPIGDLPHAEDEARGVAAALGSEALIGVRATKATVLRYASHASIIHFAAHAYFSSDSPLDSGIVLADGILTARDVISRRLEADLVVISACETGVAGPLGAGDELAGLAQAFLYAGARSLLVSLWRVDDPATNALMSTFYRLRDMGADKATALSQAMGEVRAQKRWSHPYYWGAFVLMGDWREN